MRIGTGEGNKQENSEQESNEKQNSKKESNEAVTYPFELFLKEAPSTQNDGY